MLTRAIKITQYLHSLRHQLFSVPCLLAALIAFFSVFMVSTPAHAAVDTYVRRYLKATEPVALDLDGQGQTKPFSAEDLSAGKELFETHCLNCHVGGATLPDPTVSLALNTLAGATPPRDNINGLVAFLREPMTYDGSDISFWCRQVPESWMPQEQVEKLAAFVLRAAQKAPGWGTSDF
ncbi:MAG: photosystem II cytochrome PsbV2 [Symplocastrum torsivum CPER-KK1]|jgi:photosystem II cytochrome c550|uniref:Photosystem II cytochrome PsbV2 n=1 Tax=Symplocastrum torsivum CPER-KK1 TaxID=450513 RepID=A0A951PMJ4_9CYAN|nr:photosystem II cytochrome PsbV2 [Symplocastrum torsivum CPER-KK1]